MATDRRCPEGGKVIADHCKDATRSSWTTLAGAPSSSPR